MTTETLRRSDAQTLVALLKDQQARKHDVVVPLRDVKVANDGTVGIPDFDLGADGEFFEFSRPAAISSHAMGDISEKSDVPIKYLRKLEEEDLPLLATNVNRWFGSDDRSVLLRSFGNPDGGTGVLRAMKSDSYQPFDYLDGIMATMKGFKEAGVTPEVSSVDLDETKMRVIFEIPQVRINAPDLLKHYNFKGAAGVDNPVMQLSWVLTDSEVGNGAYELHPRATILVCKNGMTMKKEGIRKIHLGSKRPKGVIQWGEDTMAKEMELVTLETRDVIQSFTTPAYLETLANQMREFSELPVIRPETTIKVVAKHLAYSDDVADQLLGLFVSSGDMTIFGVGQAITALAQSFPTGEAQALAEEGVWDAMLVAARSTR